MFHSTIMQARIWSFHRHHDGGINIYPAALQAAIAFSGDLDQDHCHTGLVPHGGCGPPARIVGCIELRHGGPALDCFCTENVGFIAKGGAEKGASFSSWPGIVRRKKWTYTHFLLLLYNIISNKSTISHTYFKMGGGIPQLCFLRVAGRKAQTSPWRLPHHHVDFSPPLCNCTSFATQVYTSFLLLISNCL